MISNINLITIKEVMARVLGHPMLQDVTLEQCVRHTLDFINKVGYPQIYDEKEVEVEINDYRGLLPCDLVSVILVKDGCEVMKKNTGYFKKCCGNPSYSTKGRYIYTTFKQGKVQVAYRAIPVDQDGFPLIPDLPVFLNALELYIKWRAFVVLFDQQKITPQILQHTEGDYAKAVAQLNSEMALPDYAEMENITNMINQLIPSVHEYSRAFNTLGDHTHLDNLGRGFNG